MASIEAPPGPRVGDRVPAEVAALSVPLPALVVWLRHGDLPSVRELLERARELIG